MRKKHVERTSMLCLSCVAQQSNVMSIEPNWEARTLEHVTSLGATNGYDKTCCVTIFAVAQDAKNKGSIGQYEGLREPTRKSQRDNNCDPSREEGCQHAEPMTNDEHNLC